MKKQSWEPDGELGKSVEHAKPVSKEEQETIDNALALVSFRIDKEVLDQLRNVATVYDMSYITLIRKILKDFLDNV